MMPISYLICWQNRTWLVLHICFSFYTHQEHISTMLCCSVSVVLIYMLLVTLNTKYGFNSHLSTNVDARCCWFNYCSGCVPAKDQKYICLDHGFLACIIEAGYTRSIKWHNYKVCNLYVYTCMTGLRIATHDCNYRWSNKQGCTFIVHFCCTVWIILSFHTPHARWLQYSYLFNCSLQSPLIIKLQMTNKNKQMQFIILGWQL